MPRKMSTSVEEQHTPDDIEMRVKYVEEHFHLGDEKLNAIADKMLDEMKKGLGKESNPTAKVKMIPSYVKSLPDGSERGSYLALDLGGTNFRVLLVTIDEPDASGAPKILMESQIYKMPKDVITGSGEKLFDHIAYCMSDFLKQVNKVHEKLPVGFTFSFPCKQAGIDHASLITWTKGFSADGVVGKDVVTMLKKAILRRGEFDCDIVAVVNDTVGTLMSCAHFYKQCKVGLIVGTGSNACYMEKLSNIDLIDEKEGDMCINMEWGAFGDDGVLDPYRNEYDEIVDENSINKGKQIYEKMISGMYMGEIVRLVLCQLTRDGLIFHGTGSEALFKPGKFESSYVSQIESAAHGMVTKNGLIGKHAVPDGILAVQNILTALDIGAMHVDCGVVIRVCEAVSRRAAHLCAAGIAAVARKIKANHPKEEKLCVTVGVDGTVYKKHPTFSKLMNQKVRDLCKDVDVEFALSYDGSGKGAALVTAVAQRLESEKIVN